MRGDQQASVHIQNVVEEKILPLNFASVLKPPNLSVDMALAKEYHGKNRASLFHDILTISCS